MRYTTSVAEGHLSLGANVYGTSRFFFDSFDQYPQGGYTTLGLRAEWTDASGRFTVALYGGQRHRQAVSYPSRTWAVGRLGGMELPGHVRRGDSREVMSAGRLSWGRIRAPGGLLREPMHRRAFGAPRTA